MQKKEAASSGKLCQQVEDLLVPIEQDGLDEEIYHNYGMLTNTKKFLKKE